MIRLTFDLETIPDTRPGARDAIAATVAPPASMSKAETIAKWEAETRPSAIETAWRKTALQGGAGRVAVIGWAINDALQAPLYDPETWGEDSGERSVIKAFFAAADEALGEFLGSTDEYRRRPQVVGHNVLNFDLRFLFQRCVILGVKPPLWFPLSPRPWDTDVVYDTMVAWTGSPRDYARMDVICEALGIGTKGSEFGDEAVDIDGSKVWDFVRDGQIETVARYCMGDVARTIAMHKRLAFFD